MQRTNISYLTHSWNPIKMKCSPMQDRIAYEGGSPVLDTKELEAPLHLRKPARIGVELMGDLFYEKIPYEYLERIFSTIRGCQNHLFFILTKRPQNIDPHYFKILRFSYENVWLGVSVEDQKTADERIPILLQIPATHHWISYEPGLGLVNFSKWLSPCGYYCDHDSDGGGHRPDRSKIGWLVVGGETGPHARPLHPDWIRLVRDQCKVAGVPFFFKSWGEWTETQPVPGGDLGGDMRKGLVEIVHGEGNPEGYFRKGDVLMRKVGHKHSGHILDGQEWRQIP